MSRRGTEKLKNLKAEVVIIGGGGAGLAAAAAAAEKGASNIIVLEKRGGPGGNTARAVGLFGVESPVQQRAAISVTRDEIFRKAMDYAHWKSNARIVRAFIDKSGDTIRWLEEKGLDFQCVALYYGQSPLVWHRPKGLGAAITKVLARECKELGVQLFTRTPAKKLLTGPKGNVTGVLAETKGEEFAITTKSVIIASGGYGGNKELLKKYYPYYNDNMRCGGIPHTGDGLLMAMEIGVATEGLGLLIGGGLPGAERTPMVLGEPYLIRVNQNGKRFIDETVVGAQHTFFGSETMPVSYTLFDHKMVQYMMEHGTIILTAPHRMIRYVPIPGLEKELRALADKDSIKISDSWGEIAEYIGCDPKVLKATIDEYNACCDQGYDPIFAKDRRYLMPLRTPPYYAIGGSSRGLLDTVGGIKINEHMEVLDKQDNPIPGLYAAGVCAGGWQAIGYCGVYMSGAAVGFAVNSGRIAGESAVKFIAGKVHPL